MRLCVLLALALLLPAVACASPDDGAAVTVVIDDMGDRAVESDRVVAMQAPLVCALLPHTPHAQRAAERCHAAGKDVMLHLPMQPVREAPLGPGGVTLDMTPQEFRAVVRDNLAAIPHVRAVNNHMGSMLTRHPGHMRWLMEVLADAGDLLFLDSRTSARTVAPQMAHEAGVPVLERDVFLDNERDPAAIERQLRTLFETARRDGTAIAIGHPYPETLDVLEQHLHEFAEAYRVELVGLAELHRRRNGR